MELTKKELKRQARKDMRTDFARDKVLRDSILKRDNFICQYCKVNFSLFRSILTVDHIIPISRDGDNSVENLVTCCKQCNYLKAARKTLSFEISKEELVEQRYEFKLVKKSKTKMNSEKHRQLMIYYNYNNREGLHTFSMCECGREGFRRYKCNLCIDEEIKGIK